jgi:formate dehydrogenase
MHNTPHIRQPEGNRALLHPEDAAARGICDDDVVEVATPQRAVRLRAQLTEDVRRGVIAVPHGWGHAGAELSRAGQLPGANINEIIPGGAANMEPVSGQAIMMAHRVEVRRVGAEVPPSAGADAPPSAPARS